MGTYNELIFGASLKEDAPKEIIDQLKFMVDEKSINLKINEDNFTDLFHHKSYYFPVSEPLKKFWFDVFWRLSIRISCKSESKIQDYLRWIKPYIYKGSGDSDIYAIVISENGSEIKTYKIDE